MHAVWNDKIFGFISFLYLGILLYFGFQTYYFVNWLFPQDNLLVKIATIVTFDGMAFVWSVACTFYRFHSKNARWWVTVGWFGTFLLSCGATICYYTVENLFRFKLEPSQDMITWGYVLTLLAVLFNILVFVRYFQLEWSHMHPHMDIWEVNEQKAAIALAQENSRILENPGEAAGNNRFPLLPQASGNSTRILGNTGQLPALPGNNSMAAMPRNTKQRAASLAIIGKYGATAVLADLDRYAREAGVDRKTLKRYCLEETA